MTWTKKDITDENYWNEKHVEKLEKNLLKFHEDSQKDIRLRQKECKTCFYLRGDRFAGQAFTNYECRNCGSLEMHPNTNTPKICKKCSEELNVCIRCGGNL